MQSITTVIKTIPDIDAGRRLYKIQNLSDNGVAKAMFHLQQQKAGSEELPHYLQRIIAIAICNEDKTEVFGDKSVSEKALLEHYALAVEGKQLVTWNGNRFVLPTLKYRALKNNIILSGLSKHLDLSSELSGSLKGESPSLYEISSFLELAEIQEDSATLIWDKWQDNKIELIKSLAQHEAENIHQILIKKYMNKS